MKNFMVFYSVAGRFVFDVFQARDFVHASELADFIFDCFITSDIRITYIFFCPVYGVCFSFSPVSTRSFVRVN